MALDIHLLNYFLLTKIGKTTNQTNPPPPPKKDYVFNQWHLIFKNFFFAEEVIPAGVLCPESKN